MAHGVHLSESDLDLLKQRGTAIAHCPLSNLFFAGKYLPCDNVMARGNKVGLGTDIAAGYSPSIMHSARMAVVASQALRIQEPNTMPPIDYRQTVYLATLGGAESLGMQEYIGTFRAGMEFDAIILSANDSPGGAVSIFPDHESLADVFQKLWVLGDDRNITRVFVQGREVKNSRMTG
jgi:guanine deaminase